MDNNALLKKELENFPTAGLKGDVLLIETAALKALEVSLTSIKDLTDRGFRVMVLSASRPCTNLINLYEKWRIDLEKIHIIDCVCHSQGLKTEDSKMVTHVSSIRNLTDISLLITKIFKDVKEPTVLFIDSITTMLLYSNEEVFSLFLHNILTRMRDKGVNVLLLMVDTVGSNLRSDLIQLCDKTIGLK